LDVNFDVVSFGRNQIAVPFAVFFVGCDIGDKSDTSVFGDFAADVADAADVCATIFAGEAETFAEVCADDIGIKDGDRSKFFVFHEFLVEVVGDCRFSATT